jgi:hypothetical protein
MYLFPKPLLLFLCSISSPLLASLSKNYLPIRYSHLQFGLPFFIHLTDHLPCRVGSWYSDQAMAFDSRKMQEVMSSTQCPGWLWYPPNLLFDGHRWWNGQCVMLRSRMSAATPLLPTHSFMAWTGTPLPLPLYNNNSLQAMCATSGRPAASATSMDATDLTCSLPTWTVGSGQVQGPRSDPQHSATPVTGVTQAASDSLSPTTVKLHRYKSATQAIHWLSSSGKARPTACLLRLPVHTLYLSKNKEF